MASGVITGSTSNSRIDSKIEWSSVPSTANNKSEVTANLYFRRNNTYSGEPTNGTLNCSMSIDGQSGSTSKKFTIPNSGAWVLALTVKKTVDHSADGSKKITISASGNISTTILTFSYSGTATLDTIPRYAKITTFTVDKKDETSVTVTWGADASCDKIYYSLNNGSWVETNGYPNFAITGLTANTSYSFKIRVRRKDSQLTTDSSAITQSTYNYPHCTSSPNFTIGQKLTLNFYNPLGRTFEVWLVLADGSVKGGDTISGTSLSGYNGDHWKTWLYSSIPNAQSGSYKVRVVYGSSTITLDNGNTYKVTGNELPTINGITYKDIDDDIVAITENDQHIVQNQSFLQIAYEPATPNNYAGSIAKYTFELNGVIKEKTSAGGTVEFGTINSANDLTLTVTVTDSRGLTSQTEIEITMLSHSDPTASVTLVRLNNYEDETYLTVDASISSVDNKNTMTVQYQYKLSTGAYGSLVTIPNGETQTLSLDKNSIFVFNVVVTDAFGSTFEKEYVLYKGVFPLFIDTEKNAVGINEFPSEGEALRVAGGTAHFEEDVNFAKSIVRTGNKYTLSSAGVAGTSGLILMARITVISANADTPITFVFSQRQKQAPMTVHIRLNNTASQGLNATVSTVRYEGTNYNAYLASANGTTASNVWELYVNKGSAYDTITLQDWWTSKTMESRVSVEFVGTLVSAVPEPFYRATPAMLDSILDYIYPVDSIYMSYSHNNPNTMFGGTWVRIENRFLWATSSSGTIGATGGEKTHTLTKNELPKINDLLDVNFYSHQALDVDGGALKYTYQGKSGTPSWDSHHIAYGKLSLNIGNGEAHNNMPPYIQVSVWRRTA